MDRFRLINAVLAYPPGMRTDLRIANGLGDIGHLTITTAAQNLGILWLLSLVVSSGVAAFCAFAAVALLFDLFFLLTFFVAVLTVDIRRLELQDSLARKNAPRAIRRASPHKRRGWMDALVQGRLPFSTRMAGTAVTTTFVLSLNYHLLDNKDKRTSFRHLLGFVAQAPAGIAEIDATSLPPINATRTPAAWLRMQEYDTAKEVMRAVNTGGHGFVARIFEPLFVVLPNSNRTDIPPEQTEWAMALRSFAAEHFYPFAVAVVFVVAFVTVLMNFLLWNDVAEEHDAQPGTPEDPLSIQTVNLPHKLDIVKLAGSRGDHFVSIGLDRTMAITVCDRIKQQNITHTVPADQVALLEWPVHKVTIDGSGDWVACHCADGQIMFYDCQEGKFLDHTYQYPDDNPPVLYKFAWLHLGASRILYHIVVTSGGRLSMAATSTKEQAHQHISQVPLLGASLVELPGTGSVLLVVTEEAQLVKLAHQKGGWKEIDRHDLADASSNRRYTGIVNITHVAKLDLLLVDLIDGIAVLDLHATKVLARVVVDDGAAVDRRLLLGGAVQCPGCRMTSPSTITIAYDDTRRSKVVVKTFGSNEPHEGKALCVHAISKDCHGLATAEVGEHLIESAGVWDTTSQAVVGLRRRKASEEMGEQESLDNAINGAVQRRQITRKRKQSSASTNQEWEAYSISTTGDLHTVALEELPTEAEGHAALYVNTAGPACTLGTQSVAVAFGNVVKVIRVGQERRAPFAEDNELLAPSATPSSKRRFSLLKSQ